MALGRRGSNRTQAIIWPGFVDAMTGLLLVLMFVLTIFMVIQFVLRETITGQESKLSQLSTEIAALSEALGLERLEVRVDALGEGVLEVGSVLIDGLVADHAEIMTAIDRVGTDGDPERLRGLITRVRQGAEDAGRDPESIEINAMFGNHMKDPAAGVEIMSELGVGRVMVPALYFAGDGGMDRLARFAEKANVASS